jgi:hypothetical protein
MEREIRSCYDYEFLLWLLIRHLSFQLGISSFQSGISSFQFGKYEFLTEDLVEITLAPYPGMPAHP